ncbi:MAG: response regulator [Magnetococcales bacterium]|nr:response regulator [Magnetococcales bacterium]
MSGIRLKLMGFISGIILLVSGVLISLSIIEHHDQMLERYQIEAEQMLSTLTETILDDLYRLDIKELRQHIQAIRKNRDIAESVLLDRFGRVLVDGSENNTTRGQEPRGEFLRGLIRSKQVVNFSDEKVLWVGAPVTVEGTEPLGWLALGLSLDDLHRRLGRHLREQLLVAVICGLLGMGLAWVLAIHFTTPIMTLTQAANRIRSGDESVEIPIIGNDEILTLSLSLEQMVARIRASQQQLRELNVSLDQKVAERTVELETARKIALEASQAKSDFLASMSHEIRTPMNAIIGLTELALQGAHSERTRDYLIKSVHAARSLLRIINDILDFSKIEAGRLELEEGSFLLRDVFDHVLDLFRARLAEKRLELVVNMGTECGYHLVGDALRLEQILMNLIGNAIKFTESGEIEVTVRLEESLGEQVVLLFSVRDTGIGLTEGQRTHLFAPFSQADGSIARKYGGTGLGLVICKRLAEMMQGRIWVESLAGHGTTFYFTVVLDRLIGAEEVALRPPDELRGGRVLVVDDNPTTRTALRNMLSGFQFLVMVAGSGTEALQKLEQAASQGEPFMLLLADWWMPDLDGPQLAHAVRRLLPTGSLVPKVMLMIDQTPDGESPVSASNLEVDGLLVKPINCSLLFDGIMDLFGVEMARAYRYTGCDTENLGELRARLGGARVLLVEDNAINQIIAREILQALGLQVTCVAGGEEAVAAVIGSEFDAVLMDIQMPGMDGYTATRRIRELEGRDGLPIIAMTAHAMSGDREKSLDAGMNDHLTKPIDRRKLYETLLRWIPKDRASAAVEVTDVAPQRIPSLIWPSLPGLDMEGVRQRLNGNLSLYLHLLEEFRHHFSVRLPNLCAALRTDEVDLLDEAANSLHAIKGLAGNLGADELFAVARELEDAIKTGSAPRERLPGVERLESCFVMLDNAIFHLHGVIGPRDIEIDTPVEILDEDLCEWMESLLHCLELHDMGSESCITPLKNLLTGTRHQELLVDLEGRIKQCDFDGAMMIYQELAQRLAAEQHVRKRQG